MAEYYHPMTRTILYLLLLQSGILGRTTDSPPSSTCQDNGCESNFSKPSRCVYVRNGNWSEIGREYDLTTPNKQDLCRSQNDPDNCCRCFIIRDTTNTTTTTTTPTTTTTTTTSTTTSTTTTPTTSPAGCTDVHGYCRAAFNGSGSCIDVRQGDLTFIDVNFEPIDGKCGAGPEKCCECFRMKTEESLFVACDDYTQVFLDGVQFTDSSMSEWDETSEISLPFNTKVIAISCVNSGGHKYGIKASTSYGIVTDATWRCSNVEDDNWMMTDFDDSTWEYAKTENLYVDNLSRPQISENAQWIWSQSGTTRAYCRKIISQEPLFTKIFAHDTSGGLFTNKDDVLWKNSGDPSAPLFSVLGSMYQMKGPFHLKLCYPELPSPNCNEWSQTSNPVTESDITGFIPISIPFSKNSIRGKFGGLGVNAKGLDRYTFIDDVPRHGYWWAAIGAYSYWMGPDTIPGPHPEKVKKVELYIGREGSSD